jgi:drug/metabolite transporter (DMT)-like permease
VCWGAPTVILRYLTHSVPDGYTTNLVRYPVATIAYIPLLIAVIRRGGLGRFWLAALLPAAVNVIAQTLFAVAPYYLEAGVMSFLVRISAVWSIVLAFCIFPDERPLAHSPRFWGAAALAVIGFLLTWLGKPAAPISHAGVLIILACSIFWALYDVTVRYTMRDINPLVVFGVIGNYTSIGLIAIAPLGRPSSVLHLDGWSVALLVISAYIGIAFAHGMYYVALQRLGVSVAAIAMLLTPFVSIIGAAVFLGERFSPMQWIGGVILVTGAGLAMWSRQHVKRVPPPDPGPD